jgi:hypothetical protein
MHTRQPFAFINNFLLCVLRNENVRLDHCEKRKRAYQNLDLFLVGFIAYVLIFELFKTIRTKIQKGPLLKAIFLVFSLLRYPFKLYVWILCDWWAVDRYYLVVWLVWGTLGILLGDSYMFTVIHVKFKKTWGTKGMPAVYHYPWNTIDAVVLFFTKKAIIFIEEFVNEFIDLFTIEIRWIFSLFEKICCWILELFHNSNINIYKAIFNFKYIINSCIYFFIYHFNIFCNFLFLEDTILI